jgi:hypothetical protein
MREKNNTQLINLSDYFIICSSITSIMDELRFTIEDHKYSRLWQDGYKEAHWKRLARFALKTTRGTTPLSGVDFGFGNGNTMDYFLSHGFHVQGVEISHYAVTRQRELGRVVHHASLDDIHILGDNQFTFGFCNDVIEHLPEEYVTPSLDEMTRLCSDYLFISVCPEPSHHLSFEGENLHLTVKPEAWWRERFERYGQTEKINFWFSRSLRYVIDLKP